ncbi:MAG: hypothetical protein ACYCTE_09715 [Acidimicrobiales bacterium]
MKTSELRAGLEVALLVRGDAKNLERAVVETRTLLDGETWKTGSSVIEFACPDGGRVAVRGEQARDGTLVLVSARHGGALVPLRRVLGLVSELAPVLDAARTARSARADELERQSAERGEYAAAASHVLGEALGGEVRVEAIGPAFHLGLDADQLVALLDLAAGGAGE